MSGFFDMVEREVRDFRREGLSVADYRISAVETASSRLGVENNRAGSPYAPLSSSLLMGGEFLIRWTDGQISRGALSRAPATELRLILESAFAGRYEDEEAANFPVPTEVPDVPLASSGVERVARGESPEVLPSILGLFEEARQRHGAKLLSGSVSATWARRRLVSSAGFRAEDFATVFGWGAGFDSLLWGGDALRVLPEMDEVRERLDEMGRDFQGLRDEADETPTGETVVILHPQVAESFLQTFVFSNLAGGAVAGGRSRFGKEDFVERRRVFREDLRISARPLVPLSIGSFRFTGEGLPARDFDLVRDGRLITPSLSLRHARRLKMEPAPAPSAIEGFEIALADRTDREAALAGDDTIVLVHSVLGMHTQDSARGEYSLLASQACLYRDGLPRGRVAVTLNGSFFDDLRSSELSFVRFPGHLCPGIRLTCQLS